MIVVTGMSKPAHDRPDIRKLLESENMDTETLAATLGTWGRLLMAAQMGRLEKRAKATTSTTLESQVRNLGRALAQKIANGELQKNAAWGIVSRVAQSYRAAQALEAKQPEVDELERKIAKLEMVISGRPNTQDAVFANNEIDGLRQRLGHIKTMGAISLIHAAGPTSNTW